jgi:hypothetical protein
MLSAELAADAELAWGGVTDVAPPNTERMLGIFRIAPMEALRLRSPSREAEEGTRRLQPWMALYLAETFKAGFAGVALAIARIAANDTTDLDNVRLSEAARKRLIEQWWAEPHERVAAG